MALYLAVNKAGEEVCSNKKLFRHHEKINQFIVIDICYKGCLERIDHWCDTITEDSWPIPFFDGVVLPKGSIEKLIGKKMTWEDEPVEI